MACPPVDVPAAGSPGTPARPIVPLRLLARFGTGGDPATSGGGRLIMERRDRTRRVLASVEEASRVAGTFTLTGPPGPPPGGDAGEPARAALARILAEVETAAEAAIEGLLAGRFPPTPEERPRVALFVALRLLLGRGSRVGQRVAAETLAEALEAAVTTALEHADETESGEAGDPDPDGEEADTGRLRGNPGPATALCTNDPERVDLTPLLPLARLLAGRTWQLARFQDPVLLTGDTPAVAWRKAGPGETAASPRLADVDEVRMPLGPRHALVMARVARLGEIVRDLEPRHAAALNRTVAEAAREWVFYHPDADPLREVALAPL